MNQYLIADSQKRSLASWLAKGQGRRLTSWFTWCWWTGLFCFLPMSTRAQSTSATPFPATTPTQFNRDLRTLPTLPDWQPGDPITEVPRHYYGPQRSTAFFQPRRDSLLSRQAHVSLRQGTVFGDPIINVEGQGFNGSNPPDANGDVGFTYFVQATNSNQVRYTFYNKADGSVAAGPFAIAPFLPCGNRGDPIVKFDPLAKRWLLVSLGQGDGVCILVSKTIDPITGGWWVYGFPTPNVPDYPKLAVWGDAYYLTANEPGQAPIYAFQRAKMLEGKATNMQRFTVPLLSGFGFQALTPADLSGDIAPPKGTPGLFLRHRDIQVHGTPIPDGTSDLLERFELSIDWQTPANSNLSGPFFTEVAPFDSTLCGLDTLECIPQPSGPNLDPIREVIMHRLAYRNFGTHQSLVGNFSVDVDGLDHVGIRWFELRETDLAPWQLHQEGTFAPDSNHRWLGTIAQDANGNIALAYNIASTTQFPSIMYAGRTENDPLGTLPDGEHIVVEGSGSNFSNRYGDYASMSVDPADHCTFWLTGMYNPTVNWSTRIASLTFDLKPSGPVGVVASANGDNRIDLTWNAVPDATSYSVYRQIGLCPEGPSRLIADGLTETSFSDTNVSGGFNYSYSVRYFGTLSKCGSAFSSCVSATAIGNCFLHPDFAGLEAVLNPQQPECRLELQWSAPPSVCPQGVTYNVYRDIQADFDPGPINRIASCLPDTQFTDNDVQSGITYFYVVRAEDQSGNGSGPCNSGNEDQNTVVLSGTASGPSLLPCTFECSFEPGLWPHFTILNLVDCINNL